MIPYLLAFAAVCGILCYGLMQRTVWMWYLGLVFFYLFSGRLCLFFFNAMVEAQTHSQVIFSIVYLIGGLVLWLPSLLWWMHVRPKFVRRW